MLRKINLN